MSKNRKLQYLIPLAFFFVVAVVIFVLGTKYDYSFASRLYEKNGENIPVFSIILCLLGPLVTNAFGAFSGTALFFTTNRKSKFWHVILKLFGIVGIIGVSFFAYTAGTEFVKVIPHVDDHTIAIGEIMVLFMVVVSDIVVGFFTWKNLNKMESKKLFWSALMMLLIVVVIAILGEIVKYLASRPRPRLIFKDSEFSFKEWYEWTPLKGFEVKECKSFVSGHSINSAAVITMLPLFLSVTKLNEKKWMVPVAVVVGGVYWLVISFSRILANAHFLTDISGACILSIVLQVAILFVVELIKNKTGDFSPVSKN